MTQVVLMVKKSDQNYQESTYGNFSRQMKPQEGMEITIQQDFENYHAQILSHHGVVEKFGNFWDDENVNEELNYDTTTNGDMDSSNKTPSQDVAISIWDLDCDDHSYS